MVADERVHQRSLLQAAQDGGVIVLDAPAGGPAPPPSLAPSAAPMSAPWQQGQEATLLLTLLGAYLLFFGQVRWLLSARS